MNRFPFDPIAVERQLVRAKLLLPRVDDPAGELGSLEEFFTEKDLRMYALWRISMIRQFQPKVLKTLSDEDLLYLAGQTPEGYEGEVTFGVQLDKNKIAQNALRARVELETRATKGAWRRNVVLAIASLVVGALLTGVVSFMASR